MRPLPDFSRGSSRNRHVRVIFDRHLVDNSATNKKKKKNSASTNQQKYCTSHIYCCWYSQIECLADVIKHISWHCRLVTAVTGLDRCHALRVPSALARHAAPSRQGRSRRHSRLRIITHAVRTGQLDTIGLRIERPRLWWAFDRANIPAVKEPVGVLRSIGRAAWGVTDPASVWRHSYRRWHFHAARNRPTIY